MQRRKFVILLCPVHTMGKYTVDRLIEYTVLRYTLLKSRNYSGSDSTIKSIHISVITICWEKQMSFKPRLKTVRTVSSIKAVCAKQPMYG